MLTYSEILMYYHLLKASMTITINAVNTIIAIIPTIGIHNGLKTHHQLQSILCVNFSTMNSINSIPDNDIPLLELLSAILLKF